METQTDSPPATSNPQILRSCRKNPKKDEATFLEDIKDHIDEFMSASMDEHKSCFKKTVQKMFGMSKVVSERNAAAEEVESSLPLRTVQPSSKSNGSNSKQATEWVEFAGQKIKEGIGVEPERRCSHNHGGDDPVSPRSVMNTPESAISAWSRRLSGGFGSANS